MDPAKIDQAVGVVLDQHYQIANGKLPISGRELKKAKEYLKGHLALALEDTHDAGSFFGDQELFTPEAVLTPEEVYKRVDKVTLEEVTDEAKKLFIPSRLNLAVIGPYNSESKFRKLLK